VPRTSPEPSISVPACSGLPDGQGLLWLSIGDGGPIPPLQLEGALIRLQARTAGSCLGKAVAHHRDGKAPGPWQPCHRARAKAPKVWSSRDTAMCRVWPWTRSTAGLGERNTAPAAAMSSNFGWRPARTTAGLWFTIAASIRSPISAAQSAPGLVDPRRVLDPAMPPPGLAIDPWRSVIPGWSGNLFAGGLRLARCAQDQPAGR